MKKVVASLIFVALQSLMFPCEAQDVRSNTRTEPDNQNVIACTTSAKDKNRLLSGWQELIGRSRGEAERRANEINAVFSTVSENQATITTRNGEIITIGFTESDQTIRAVCRSRSEDNSKN